MPIGLTQGLKIGSIEPADARFVAADFAALTNANNYDSGTTYNGLIAYVESEQKYYVLRNKTNVSIAPGLANSGWTLLANAAGSITTVNGNAADNGNITVGLITTYVGLSSSANYTQGGIGDNYPGGPTGYPALSGSFPFYKFSDGSTPGTAPSTGSMWVVTGETIASRTGSNGQVFLFVSSSTIPGRWNPVTAYATAMLQAAADNITVQNATNAQSASTILAYDGTGITTTMPLLMFPESSLDAYDTPYGTGSLAYNPVTNILEGTAEAATGLQLGDGSTVSADNVPYVDGNGTLIIPDGTGGTPNELPFDEIGQIDYYTSTNNPDSTVTASLSSLQVLDYTNGGAVNSVSVNWNAGTGKLILQFGTPANIDASYLRTSATVSGTDTWSPNRFNTPDYGYTLYAGWALGNDTLVTASLWVLDDGTYVKLSETTTPSATSLTYVVNSSPANNVYGTSGNSYPNASLAAQFGGNVGTQTFQIQLTGSNVGGTLHYDSFPLVKTLAKTEPTVPTQAVTYQSNDIASWDAFSTVSTSTTKYVEYGDTGVISHTGTYGTANGWNPTALTLAPSTANAYNIDASTNNIAFRTTASYDTNSQNTPNFTIQKFATNITISRKRSIRIGFKSHVTGVPNPSQVQLEDVANWSTETGGGSPFCYSGDIYYDETSNPTSKAISFTIPSGFGMADLYIVTDVAYPITQITNAINATVYSTTATVADPAFAVSTVGGYKVYKTTNSLGVGPDNTYNFTIYT